MLAVVDTKVIVSGLLNKDGTPARVTRMIAEGILTPVFSFPILAEYEDVLHRAKFHFEPSSTSKFLADLKSVGMQIEHVAVIMDDMPDMSDTPFLLAARHAGCPLITGNIKHFPKDAGVDILTPARFVERFHSS